RCSNGWKQRGTTPSHPISAATARARDRRAASTTATRTRPQTSSPSPTGCGWAVVDLYPERIRSWSALSVPHIGAFGRAIRDDPDQQQRSQYITFFQEPGVAEAALSA